MAFNLSKYTKVLLLSATFACNAWGAAGDFSTEQKVRAAAQAVQYKADQELAKKHDKWWDEYCRYVGMHDKEVSLETRLLRSGQYYHDVADKTPDQVLWLMSGGHGTLISIKVSDEARSKYRNNHKLAMEKIVETSMRNQINYVGDHLKAKQIGDSFLENLNQQINDLMAGKKISDAKILQLESKVDSLELRVIVLERKNEALEKDKLNFFKQLKERDEKLQAVRDTNLALEKEVIAKTGEASKAQALADKQEAHEKEKREAALKHQQDLDNERAKADDERAKAADKEFKHQQELKAALAENEILKQKFALKEEQEKIKAEYSGLEGQLKVYEKMVTDFKMGASAFSEEIGALKFKLLNKESIVQNLQDHIDALTVKISSCKTCNPAVQEISIVFESKRRDLNNNSGVNNVENMLVENMLDELNNNSMKQSQNLRGNNILENQNGNRTLIIEYPSNDNNAEKSNSYELVK